MIQDKGPPEAANPPDVPSELKDRALDEAAEGIAISDPGQPDNPLIYCNRGFEQLTGYTRAEAVGTNCRFLQGPGTDAASLAEIRSALRDGHPCRVELLNYRKDGTPFWNRLSLTPVRDCQGRVTNFIGVQSDVTAYRDALEEVRRARDELQQANRHMRQGLELAARVQQALLPEQAPQAGGVIFSWLYEPCEELAGDILNVFRLDPRHIGIYVLDVSGHGVPAALLSVTLSRWLGIQAARYAAGLPDVDMSKPADVAERLNRDFQMDERLGQYFTLLYGVLDCGAREFRYVSAGHPPPAVLRAGRRARLEDVSGFPIGVVTEPQYESRRLSLGGGDRVVLYTDGLTEAADAEGKPFGEQRLLAELERTRTEKLDDCLPALVKAARTHRGEADFEDDVSLVAMSVPRQAD
ncbi:MAG: SpoIIE family protein phosphatase [Phycisphaerae bacterium]